MWEDATRDDQHCRPRCRPRSNELTAKEEASTTVCPATVEVPKATWQGANVNRYAPFEIQRLFEEALQSLVDRVEPAGIYRVRQRLPRNTEPHSFIQRTTDFHPFYFRAIDEVSCTCQLNCKQVENCSRLCDCQRSRAVGKFVLTVAWMRERRGWKAKLN